MKKIFFAPLGILAFTLQSNTTIINGQVVTQHDKTPTVELRGDVSFDNTATLQTIDLSKFNFNISSIESTYGPEISFKKEKHDFGTIPQGVPVKTTFTFENTGNSNLVINKATAGCGCTTPTYSKEPIAPGKKGVIEVGYDAKAVGNFVKDITVETNGGSIKLLITGTVEVVASDGGAGTEIKMPTKKKN